MQVHVLVLVLRQAMMLVHDTPWPCNATSLVCWAISWFVWFESWHPPWPASHGHLLASIRLHTRQFTAHTMLHEALGNAAAAGMPHSSTHQYSSI
jgi:hypothetical protein